VAKPLGSAVAITSYSKGEKQIARLDSGEDGAEDVGYAVSCLYFCGSVGGEGGPPQPEVSATSRSGAVRLTNQSDKKTAVIEHKKDRLICWRSKDVENEVLEVLNPEENLFSVKLWLHGCITSKENVIESIGRLKNANLKGT